ncbi:hypothetical protein SAMN02745163_01566 [Clostridium cavendishii DSM 21758]|uniref:Phage-related protein n=1 Tax=Clostridium cavendishii DSM 21758 TaxID=1121302 RepID=A0A1M6HSS3_9CLOT|nr:hypothetical protein [Clostridium cavendishii]SHJ25208.1 hypothetical protein SAMN02745163_01566 [Clostridium cavendishii DSM 21758]
MANLPTVIEPILNIDKVKSELSNINKIAADNPMIIDADYTEVKEKAKGAAKETESLATKAVKGIETALKGLEKKIGDVAKKSIKVGSEFDKSIGKVSVADKQKELDGEFDKIYLTLYKKFEEPIKKALDTAIKCVGELGNNLADGKLSGGLDTIADAFSKLIDKVCELAIKWLPKVIDILSFVSEHAGLITSAIVGIGTAISVLNIAARITKFIESIKGLSLGIGLLGGSTTLIIAGVAAVIVAIITLWNTSETFRNIIITGWQAIQEIASVVWGGLVTFFTETIPQAWQSVIDFFVGIPDWFSGLWTNIQLAFVNGWQAIVNFFTETIPAWIASVLQFLGQLPENIGFVLGFVIGKIVLFALECWNWINNELPLIISGIISWFASLPGQIWNWLVNAYNNIVQWGSNVFTNATLWIGNTINSIVSWFSNLPNRIGEWLKNTIDSIIQWGSNMVDKGAAAASDLVSNIANTVSNLPQKMSDIGENIVKGIWNGITGMASWIQDKISGFATGVLDGFKKALGIHSPSTLFRDVIGLNLVKGIGVGINLEMPNLQDDIDKNLTNMTSRLKNTVDFESSKMSYSLTSKAVYDSANASPYIITNNNDKGVTQNVTIVNPERTPSENARALRKVGRDLVFG